MKREWSGAAGERGRRRNAELEIPRGLKAELLPLQERLSADRFSKLPNDSGIGLKNELPTGELSEKPFKANRPQPAEDAGQLERRNAINAKEVQRFGVVAEHHWAALGWTPPQALLSKRELPALHIEADVRVQKLQAVDAGIRSCRRKAWNVVDRKNELPRAIG